MIGVRAKLVGIAGIAVAAGILAASSVAAGPLGGASSGAIGASLGAGAQVAAEAASDGTQNTSIGGSGSGPGGTVASAQVSISASSEGALGSAEASVTASGISLLGGRVQVGSVALAVRAEAGPAGGSAGIVQGAATGVVVDGQPAAVGPGSRLDVAGLATIVFLEQVADPAGAVRANAIRVEVTGEGAGVPVGTQLVVGHLEASATAGTPEPAPAPVAPASPVAPAPAAPAASAPRPAPGRRVAPDPTLAPPTPTRATPEPEDPAPVRVPTTPAVTGQAPAPALPPPITLPEISPTPTPLGLPRLPAPDLPAVPPTGDGYVFPVYGETSFTNDYGAPRASTGWHHGNDVFGPEGLPVLAVADGTLSLVGTNRLGGNRLWLTDGRGNQFYYAHLQAYAPGVEDGVRVAAGQVIGFLGRTGEAITTPPHLHFEIHPGGGDSINPYPYLLAWSRRGDVPLAFRAAALAPGSAPAAGALLVSYTAPVIESFADPDGRAEAVG